MGPGVNFMTRKVSGFFASTWNGQRITSHFESSVPAFREVRPGVFFPEGVKMATYQNGKLVLEGEVTFRDVRINEPIDPGILTLRFPAGIWVNNLAEGTVYPIGADEKPSAPPKLLPVAVDRGDTHPPLPPDQSFWTAQRVVLAILIPLTIAGAGWSIWSRSRKVAPP